MNVAVLGATGFIGRHLVEALLQQNHQVVAVARSAQKMKSMPWKDRVSSLSTDVYSDEFGAERIAETSDVVVDLVWPGLPNYLQAFHFEVNLPASYRMLKSLVSAGCTRLIVAGTCLEYGMKNGALAADTETSAQVAYAHAKDSLRRSLEFMAHELPFELQWARLFYAYGEGQSANSLLPLLDAAIDRGDDTFKMSEGEQLRDFLPVEEVASQLCKLVERSEIKGPVNICSGQPISVRRFVEQRILARKSSIQLELGHYPYPSYEPLAFWGIPNRALSRRFEHNH